MQLVGMLYMRNVANKIDAPKSLNKNKSSVWHADCIYLFEPTHFKEDSMRHITKRLLAGMLFLGPLGASADPVALNFHQGGFDEGAMVSGSFVGHDLDNNGQLSSFDGEILDFIMSFTGNSLVSAFSLGFSDLFGLVYDLDGGPLGDGLSLDIEGVGATDFQFAYFAGPGPVDVCGIGVPCAAVFDHKGSFSLSDELITVSVPEPGTLALLCIGLAGFGFSRNRKNA